RDAMPNGGKLIIETTNADVDSLFAAKHEGIEPGPYVQLAVSDTGLGMSESTRLHVFDPFFTTKRRGEGTGLGLATVYGIVKQSGGAIWLYSELGRGTTFKIFFPKAKRGRDEAVSVPTRLVTGGSETILVAED